MVIARTARAAFTKSSPARIWLYYFEKCSNIPFMVNPELDEGSNHARTTKLHSTAAVIVI